MAFYEYFEYYLLFTYGDYVLTTEWQGNKDLPGGVSLDVPTEEDIARESVLTTGITADELGSLSMTLSTGDLIFYTIPISEETATRGIAPLMEGYTAEWVELDKLYSSLSPSVEWCLFVSPEEIGLPPQK